MNRIVTPDGMVPGQGDQPPRPPTLQERLDAALEYWKFKRKDEAFATALNAIAYLSSGLAGMAKLTKQLEDSNAALTKRVEALEAKAPPP
jgi:hypothetical protein